ncbi:hypothetical protein [Streptomyces sp. NPDC059874]|uniref:hypothetical protein n=1 Tax=Streptomyces sp. NPDC059874 TaxID=3346983 RepID=UPI00365FD0C9
MTRRVGDGLAGIADSVPVVEGNVDSKTDKYRNVDGVKSLADAPRREVRCDACHVSDPELPGSVFREEEAVVEGTGGDMSSKSSAEGLSALTRVTA